MLCSSALGARSLQNEQRDHIVRIGDGQRVERRKEKEIVGEHAQQAGKQRRQQSVGDGRQQNRQQEHQRDVRHADMRALKQEPHRQRSHDHSRAAGIGGGIGKGAAHREGAPSLANAPTDRMACNIRAYFRQRPAAVQAGALAFYARKRGEMKSRRARWA